MRGLLLHISLLLAIGLAMVSCDRTPGGVIGVNKMADLIVDLQLAEAYIESHTADFEDDSSKLVIKQSIFKKHGITQQDYDSSLVWYAHNMEDYNKAFDKAALKLKERYDKLGKSTAGETEEVFADRPTHDVKPRGGALRNYSRLPGAYSDADSVDLWQGQRNYTLAQGMRHGFITFDMPPDVNKQPGDRYQLAYKLLRGGNQFKVSLNVDYTDGGTSQISRSTNSDGWVVIDVQSDSTRNVRRIYGYVSYDIKRGHTAYVDSLTLMRTHLSQSNYGFFNAQRKLERRK